MYLNIHAAGHEGNGIALSAITRKIISEIIADDHTQLTSIWINYYLKG